MSRFSEHDRIVLGRLFDILIPDAEGMPSATAMGVERDLLDRVANFRPDLVPDLLRVARRHADSDAAEAVQALFSNDAEGFAALGLAAAGGYYIADEVRRLLAYTGPERRVPLEPGMEPDFLAHNLLDSVLRRPLMWRDV